MLYGETKSSGFLAMYEVMPASVLRYRMKPAVIALINSHFNFYDQMPLEWHKLYDVFAAELNDS